MSMCLSLCLSSRSFLPSPFTFGSTSSSSWFVLFCLPSPPLDFLLTLPYTFAFLFSPFRPFHCRFNSPLLLWLPPMMWSLMSCGWFGVFCGQEIIEVMDWFWAICSRSPGPQFPNCLNRTSPSFQYRLLHATKKPCPWCLGGLLTNKKLIKDNEYGLTTDELIKQALSPY